MSITVKAILINGDNIDTDVLYPGKYLNVSDPQEAREHLFEGLDPKLRDLLKEGPTALFVGENFGAGSSREQPASAMKASGVQCVFGKSFARIFGRNAINVGMPAFVNPDAALAVKQGAEVEINLETGVVKIDGVDYPSVELPALPREILGAGGLVPWVKARRRGAVDSTSGG